MTDPIPGRFWAVGVGPGDPELLTVKAINVLARAQVIYHAGPQNQQGRAWDIIRAYLRPEQETRCVLAEPMSVVSASDWRAQYRSGVEQIVSDCRRGLNVAYVAEGDPTVYSTASYVWELLAELAPDIPIEIVPGVSSITAAAARVGWGLAQKDEILTIIPAGYHQADLGRLIDQSSSVCLLKVSQAMPHLLRALEVFGATREAVYVENLGTDREWIAHELVEAADRKSYFALVLVRRTAEDAGQGQQMSPGKLWVVGLGPGDPRLLTQQALETLQSAEIIIGYTGYLELLASLHLPAELHGSPIGAETERAHQALDLAAAGRRVVLVSSGDAGVYGMASLLLEASATKPDVDIELVPGVTSATAAASLLGAPLGHDFACVSLSDLLTPWETIEKRLEAVGQSDFVLALYNPISRRRTWQLPRARDILLKYRRPETPVGLVRKAYRPGMEVRLSVLGDLSAEGIDMETMLIIGSSTTRVIHGRLVTPRGYEIAKK